MASGGWPPPRRSAWATAARSGRSGIETGVSEGEFVINQKSPCGSKLTIK